MILKEKKFKLFIITFLITSLLVLFLSSIYTQYQQKKLELTKIELEKQRDILRNHLKKSLINKKQIN